VARLNNIHIIGNVGSTRDLKYTKSGMAVFEFSVAVNGYRQSDTPDWFSVTTWEGLAETCSQFIKTGMQVMVEGSAHVEAYINKNNEPVGVLKINANDVQFLAGTGDE